MSKKCLFGPMLQTKLKGVVFYVIFVIPTWSAFLIFLSKVLSNSIVRGKYWFNHRKESVFVCVAV